MPQPTIDARLSEFRRKYYQDKILRGSLILALLMCSLLLVALLGEGLFGFSAKVRTGMVLVLGLAFAGTLGYMVLWPAAMLTGLVRGISDFDIADMVRRAFPNINDKLTNLLQLRREAAENALALAAIDQKSAEITPVRISSAIDLRVNLRFLRWLALPASIFLLIFLLRPEWIASSSTRLLHYDREFLPPPPFTLDISGIPQQIVAGQPITMTVKVNGDELPAELSLFVKKASEGEFVDYTLEKKSPTEFTYTLSDLKENISLMVGNPEVKSKQYDVAVLRRPFIKKFQIQIKYPDYTGLGTEILDNNIGDFKALRGSTVTWTLEAQGETKEARMVIGGSAEKPTFRPSDGKMALSYRLMQDVEYYLSLQSPQSLTNVDTVRYRATVLPDRYPSVYVISPNQDFTIGVDPTMPLDVEISDDFGFTKAALYYRFTKSGGITAVSEQFKEQELPVKKNVLLQPFSQMVDLTALGMKEGDELEYYVKVWDNDGVSGAKASSSAVFKVNYPTLDAKYDEVASQQQKVEDQLDQMQKKADDLQEQYEKMQQKLLEQKRLSFDDKKEMQQLLKEHQQMLEQMEQTQKQFEETKQELQNNQMITPETLQKYEQLNQFMKQMQNPEVEKMLQELQEKMDQLKPDEIRQKMEQLQYNDEDIRNSLERTLELLKQLEVAQKTEELRNKLENLKAKEDLLNEQTSKSDKPEDLENISDRQEDLNNQMDQIQQDLEQLKEQKKELGQQQDMQAMEQIEKMLEEARKEMENAEDQAQKAAEQQQQSQQAQEQGNQKQAKQSQQAAQQSKANASQQQKSASQKMQEAMNQLAQMQSESQQQEDEANLEGLRDLLENLLKLSFDQEDLRDQVRALKYGDPVLRDRSQQQKKLADDMELVRDSLQSLANKIFQIQKFVLDESGKITRNMAQSQSFFRNKQIPMITYHQQQAMTSMNNLANMLSEVMNQMQQQMKSAKPGSGMCQKPGKKPGGQKPNLSQQQRELNQQMQNMMNGSKMSPDALREMAARQEAIRKQLQEAHQKMQQEGGKMLGDVGKMMEDMQKTEDELVRQQITQETLMRQQEILSRLLQSERAVRERDLDEQRESNTARAEDRKSPDELTRQELQNRIRQELLKSSRLEYTPDFIRLIEAYYQKIENP